MAPARASKDLTGWWFIAPFFLLFTAFGAFGLLFSFYVSFHFWDPIGGTGEMYFRGLKPYWIVFTDGEYWAALLRSLRDGLPGVVSQHAVALPLAFAVFLSFRRIAGVLGVVFFLPYIASPIALSASLGLLFSLVTAPVNDVLSGLSSLPLVGWLFPYQLPYWSAFEVFSSIWTRVGWNMLLYLMAFAAVPRSLLEAAMLDGAGFWRQFRFVAIPVIRPMIFVAFSMSLVTGLQANAWTGNFEDLKTALLPGYISGTAFKYFNLSLASTQTWVFFLVMLALVAVAYQWFGRNFTALELPASLESDHAPNHLPRLTALLIKLAVTVGVIFSVYPLLLLLAQATQGGGSGSNMLRLGDGAGLNYAMLTSDLPEFWRNLWNSVYVSSLASLGAMATSALAGFAFALLEFRYKRPLFAVVMAAMVFPAMSNAVPYLIQMRILDWIDQPRSLWVPATVSALGVFLVRQFALGAIPKSLLEAARIDGASDALVFTRIALPMLMPVVATVGLVTFIGTWNHLDSALLLMRSDATRLLPQALGFLSRANRDAALFGAAIGLLPPMLVYAITAGQLGRGFGIVGQNGSSLWRQWRVGWLERARARPVKLPGVLDGADGVRAIACLAVVFSHLAQRLEMPKQVPIVQEIQAFLMTGAFGVSAFFVLSGMLLSIPFWRRYLDGQPAPNLLEYARRRFLRIAPGFYASLIVVFVLARTLEPGQHMWERLISGLTFTTAFSYITLFPVELNGPLWSIGFEVFCYLLMPAGMIGLFALAGWTARARGVTRTTTRTSTRTTSRSTARGTIETVTRTTTRTTVREPAPAQARVPGSPALAFAYWVAVLVATILAHRWIMTHLVPDEVERGWQYGLIGGAKFWMPHYNPVGLFAQYAIGVLAAGAIAYRQRQSRLLGQSGRARGFDLLAGFAFVAAAAVVFAMRRANEFSFSLGEQPYAFPTFAILVALVLFATPFGTVFHRVLDNAFFRYTAKISFGLYIWHYPILELVRLLHQSDYRYFGIGDLGYWFVLSGLVLGLAYLVAALSYTHIESPFLRETRSTRRDSSPTTEARAEPVSA